jgi:Mg-chelatase subunit ChlD
MRPLGAERSFVYPSGHAIGEAPRVFELDFSLEAGRSITALDCPNQLDARVVKATDKTASVALARAGKALGSDVVVRWSEASPALDLGVRAAKEPAYVEARFSFTRDPSPDATPPRDVVFVVDTSLSMAGDALEREKMLVSEAARLLNARDRIALVTFDAEVRSWASPVVADETNKKRLSDEVALLRASGASNLDAAIDRAHELLAELPHPTLVMGTDGQATVGEDLDRISPASPPEAFSGADVRVALFNYPSRQKPLEAVFPRLKTEFVPSGPAGADRVRRLAELALAPRIENVHFDVEGLSPDSLSGDLPAVMALGDSAHFAFRAPGVAKVRVTGTLHGQPIVEERTIVAPEVVDSSDPLPTEWARLRIATLEEKYRASHEDAVRAEIVSLGTSFHLVSSLTSLVAADDALSPDRVMPGDPEIRVRAPRGASAVRAVLPWGETVDCDWEADEGLWFGRFLVPRSVADGLYRVPIFVEIQGRSERRTTLLFRVDSKAPEFTLALRRDGGELRLVATPKEDVFDRDGSGIRKDRVDLKSLVARIGDRSIVLERIDEDHWGAALPPELRGATGAELVATDYALNISHARHALKVLR